MSIQDRVNEIIAYYKDEDWNRLSRIYLNGADGSTGKGIERDTLTKIADHTVAGNDGAVIEAIANKEVTSQVDSSDKKIKLFLLSHRSRYNPGENEQYLKGSLEDSNTSSEAYIARAQSCGLGLVTNPSAENQGYELIGTDNNANIYHLVEYNKLYGREQPLGFAVSIGTAACIHNGITNQIIPYFGYFFEGGGNIPNITGVYSARLISYIIYTPAGGPLSENNWIIKVVESASSNFVGEDIYKPYAHGVPDSLGIIKKTYIHFFKYNGTYVRRAIDRSSMVKQGSNLNNLDIWTYEDYNNPVAIANGENFRSVWNSCYGAGNNKVYGAPSQKDYSLFWNQGEPGGKANGIAYNGSNSWKGQEA